MKYYSIKEAASKIGITRWSLYRNWIYKGRIRVERIAGHPLISVAEIERIKAIRAEKAGDDNE